MNISMSSLGCSVLLASLLSACGGGGSSTPATPAPIFGQAEAKSVAVLGLLTSELVFGQIQSEPSFFANYIVGYSNGVASGSSSAAVFSCATASGGSGTYSAATNKSGVYVGLKPNDKITLSFNACNLGGTGLVLNGGAVAVSNGTYANLPSNALVQFALTTTNMDFGSTTSKTRSNGVQSVVYDSTISANLPLITSTATSNYSVAYFNPASASAASLIYTLNAGASVVSKLLAANTFSSKLDGLVTYTTTSGNVGLNFNTITPLTGSLVSGRPIPTAGVLRVKETSVNLLTETSISGSTATVKADSNGDGTLDLTFATTYTALTF
jgi:hypothetical protein